jgi:ribonuclease P protein component
VGAWSSRGGGEKGGSASPPEVSVRSEAFRPEDRVRKRREYRQLYDQGRRQGGRAFVVFLLPNDLHRPRLGITTTRRVGGAVVRNRMRRVVREVFRRNRQRFGLLDVLVHVRPVAARLPFSELRRDLLETVRRARTRLESP